MIIHSIFPFRRSRFALNRRWLCLLSVSIGAATIPARAVSPLGPEFNYAPSTSSSAVQDKDFYLITLWEDVPALREPLRRNPVLARLGQEKMARWQKAQQSGPGAPAVYCSVAQWSEHEVDEVGDALGELMEQDRRFAATLVSNLRRSGYYQRFAALPDRELVRRAWMNVAAAMNRCVQVYALGQPPQYADDAPVYDPKSKDYQLWLNIAGAVMTETRPAEPLFTEMGADFTLELLRLNGRDDACRYDSLAAKENQMAFDRLKATNWANYPYSAIVVLGAGSRLAGTELSPRAGLRVQVAAKYFAQKLAPVVLTTGGCVHPLGTHYNESIAMRNELVNRWNVPSEAVLLEPTARHTTTNIRNAVRVLYHGKLPLEKPMLIVTDPEHLATILDPKFAQRCERELGYLPGNLGKQQTDFSLSVLPSILSLHRDPMDPLDP